MSLEFIDRFEKLAVWSRSSESRQNYPVLNEFCELLKTNSWQNLADDAIDFFETKDLEAIISLNHQMDENSFAFEQILSTLVEELVKRGHSENLLTSFQNKIDKLESDTFCFLMAWLSLNSNRQDLCIGYCNQAKLSSAEISAIKGQAFWELSKPRHATVCFEKASELAPLQALNWFWLGKCYWSSNRFLEGWQAATECIKLVPGDIEAHILAISIFAAAPTGTIPLHKLDSVLLKLPTKILHNGFYLSHLIEIGAKYQSKVLERTLAVVRADLIVEPQAVVPSVLSLVTNFRDCQSSETWRKLVEELAVRFRQDTPMQSYLSETRTR